MFKRSKHIGLQNISFKLHHVQRTFVTIKNKFCKANIVYIYSISIGQ